jgi:hypothetical protein
MLPPKLLCELILHPCSACTPTSSSGEFQRVLGDIEEANPDPPLRSVTELKSSRLSCSLQFLSFLLFAILFKYLRGIRTCCVLGYKLPLVPSPPFSALVEN